MIRRIKQLAAGVLEVCAIVLGGMGIAAAGILLAVAKRVEK